MENKKMCLILSKKRNYTQISLALEKNCIVLNKCYTFIDINCTKLQNVIYYTFVLIAY